MYKFEQLTGIDITTYDIKDIEIMIEELQEVLYNLKVLKKQELFDRLTDLITQIEEDGYLLTDDYGCYVNKNKLNIVWKDKEV